MQTSRRVRAAVVATAMACGGCEIIDDDEPPPPGGTGDMGSGEQCTDLIEATCKPGMNAWVNYSEGGGHAVLIDDPVASIAVGPSAWLVGVDSASDYVGTYHDDGQSCMFACAWCEVGQFVCRGPMTEHGPQGCVMCFADGSPESGEQCAALQKVCLSEGEDGSLDETGGGTTGGSMEYDCSTWQPEQGVQQRRDGSVTVAAALVEDALLYQGEPLASCDDTRFRSRPDGYFEISRMADDGLLAMMGLELGDVIMALDGKPLNGLGAAIQALDELASAASFTVTINRGGGRFELRVNVR